MRPTTPSIECAGAAAPPAPPRHAARSAAARATPPAAGRPRRAARAVPGMARLRGARAPAQARPDVFAPFRCDWFRILAELQQLGMCCSDVARYLRVADSTVRNWKYGTEPVHSRGEALRALLERALKEHRRLSRKYTERARRAGAMQAWLRAQEEGGAGDGAGVGARGGDEAGAGASPHEVPRTQADA